VKLTLAVLLMSAGSVFVVLIARPIPAPDVRLFAILALILLSLTLLRRGWMESCSGPTSERVPGLLERWPILWILAIGAATYVVLVPFTLPTVVVRLIGMVGVLFFGLLGGLTLLILRRRRFAVRLDEVGVLDRTTLIASPRPIEWSEIQSVATRRYVGQRFVLLSHAHPREYVSRQAAWRRPLLRANWALVGTPIAMAASGLDREPDDLVRAIQSHLSTTSDANVHATGGS